MFKPDVHMRDAALPLINGNRAFPEAQCDQFPEKAAAIQQCSRICVNNIKRWGDNGVAELLPLVIEIVQDLFHDMGAKGVEKK